jgi:hypothetical protein
VIPPKPGETKDIKFTLTHTECVMLDHAVVQIDRIARGRGAAAIVRWLDGAAQADREAFVTAATELAKFVTEEILEV